MYFQFYSIIPRYGEEMRSTWSLTAHRSDPACIFSDELGVPLCGTRWALQFLSLVRLWLLLTWTEKAMATHSSTLAWKIPWTEEPGRLQSMKSLRVGHDWATSLSLFTSMHWRRKWQPTPVFLPGESQGRGSLVGCRLWGRTESDTTEVTQQQQQQQHLL